MVRFTSLFTLQGPPGPTGEPGKAEINNNENVGPSIGVEVFLDVEILKN